MRPIFLLLVVVGLLSAPENALGQPAGSPSRESAVDEAEITAVVRKALRAPDAPESWAGLAQALSSLGPRGPQGQLPQGVMAAVRIADSLAFSPLQSEGAERAVGASADGPGFLASLPRSMGKLLPRSMEQVLPLAVAGLVLLSLVATGWLPGKKLFVRLTSGNRRRPGSPVRSGLSGRARGSSEGNRKKKDVRSMALSLAEHGLPANEVARRTGLAQDEVAVVLALHQQRRGSSWNSPSVQGSG